MNDLPPANSPARRALENSLVPTYRMGDLQGRRDEGLQELDAICSISATRVPLSAAKCRLYLEDMEYDLGGKKRRALETFFDFLIRRGEIAETALPLRIYTGIM